MTRKDYVALAEAIQAVVIASTRWPKPTTAVTEAYQLGWRRAVEHVSHQIADVLAKDNPRFDFARFMEACGF